jgi:hypothetical protein
MTAAEDDDTRDEIADDTRRAGIQSIEVDSGCCRRWPHRRAR